MDRCVYFSPAAEEGSLAISSALQSTCAKWMTFDDKVVVCTKKRGVSTRRPDVLSQPGKTWRRFGCIELIGLHTYPRKPYLFFAPFMRDLHRASGWHACMSDAAILQVRSEWHCPELCSAFGGYILRGHAQIAHHQRSSLFDPRGAQIFS